VRRDNDGVPKKRRECVEFGRRIRFLREKKGLSQEAFADAIGIHRTYIGGIERGERNPTLTMIYRIAQALKLTPAKLLPAR
jgi:transcriptional regulator with XRE-family HTH domain